MSAPGRLREKTPTAPPRSGGSSVAATSAIWSTSSSDGAFSLVLDFAADDRTATAPPELRDEARRRFEEVWNAFVAALGG